MRTKRTIHPLLNQPTKTKWATRHIKEDKGVELKVHKTIERLVKVMVHNMYRDMYIISKIPLPNKFKLKLLYDNHSRKRIRRRK